MYLKSLKISGFKSFAKKGFLEFKTPISAIVGPNGSGKSNIAEAFRFVLGEQSMKTLRSKRGEDLIFSGSREERSMNRAGVKIVFDNSNRFLNIDYDEVSIERIVHRDGVNQYFINKSQVRLKDVSELLSGANIGSSGHHIISQGEADKILNVNSKERRGIIEEALGLKIYQYKILESEKKMGKVDENIKDVFSLRREIAPHLKFLKKQVKKIEQSVELKTKLINLYQEYFKRESEYLKFQKKATLDDKSKLEKESSLLEEKLEKTKKILEGNDKIQKSDKLIKIEELLKELRLKKSILSRDVGKVEGMIVFEKRRLEKQKEEKKDEENKLIKFREVKFFIDDLNKEITFFSKDDFVGRIKSVIEKFLSKNLKKEVQGETDNKELLSLKKEKDSLDKKMDLLIVEEKRIFSELEKVKEEEEEERESERKAELKIFEIKVQQSEIFAKLNKIKDLEKQIKDEDVDYKKEVSESFVLAGREAGIFSNFEIGIKEILKEDRKYQKERLKKIERIKIKLEEMGTGSGKEILKEYNEIKNRDNFLEKEIDDLKKSEVSLRKLIEELKEKLDFEFKEGLEKINSQFNEFFITMFGGGKAKLFVVKTKKRRKRKNGLLKEIDIENLEEDDFNGIDIDIFLPNKKTKGLRMLSGGERSLTSIALLFAMSQIKPPPFIILDETDAALDEANSRRYGDMINNLSKYSQLILITHNRETMSRAGILYGITMGMNGVSKLLSVRLEEAVKVAK